jgi:hypothetical protein
MDSIRSGYLAALREELGKATDPQTIADLTAEIERLLPLENARSVPSARTR